MAEGPGKQAMGYILGKAEGRGELWHGHVTAVTVRVQGLRGGRRGGWCCGRQAVGSVYGAWGVRAHGAFTRVSLVPALVRRRWAAGAARPLVLALRKNIPACSQNPVPRASHARDMLQHPPSVWGAAGAGA